MPDFCYSQRMSRDLIQMSLRRVREGRGSYAVRPSTDWVQQVPDLNALFKGIPYLVIGGLATRLYMPERMTLDIDILIAREQGEEAEQVLKRAGATFRGPLSFGGSSWHVDGRLIDVVLLEKPWLPEAFAHPQRGSDGLPYIDLPWLILLKLEASRSQDLADCARMLGVADEAMLKRVRCAVQQYCPMDIDDVESLIKLGRLEQVAERE